MATYLNEKRRGVPRVFCHSNSLIFGNLDPGTLVVGNLRILWLFGCFWWLFLLAEMIAIISVRIWRGGGWIISLIVINIIATGSIAITVGSVNNDRNWRAGSRRCSGHSCCGCYRYFSDRQ